MFGFRFFLKDSPSSECLGLGDNETTQEGAETEEEDTEPQLLSLQELRFEVRRFSLDGFGSKTVKPLKKHRVFVFFRVFLFSFPLALRVF